jgi:hypothetical protein
MRKIAAVAILVSSLCLLSCARQDSASNSSQTSGIASPAIAATPTGSPAPSFTVCKGTFALCTTARCGGSGTDQTGKSIPCTCEVKQDFSVGTNACSTVPQGPPTRGQALPSRYFPIQSTAVCEGPGKWAMCLDSPCIVDKNDPTKANCDCKLMYSKNYVVIAATASDSMCKSAIWSSATVDDVIGVTGFLFAQNPPQLKPFPINIVRVDSGQ